MNRTPSVTDAITADRYRWPAVLAVAALLTGCGNDRFTGFGASATSVPAPPAADAAPGPGARIVPSSNLSGRWTLSSPGAGSCAMTFGATPGASEGTIAPAGGCPFNFFTSRKWTFEDGGLVMRDHNAQVLAQLSPAGGDRYEGKAASGQMLTLAR